MKRIVFAVIATSLAASSANATGIIDLAFSGVFNLGGGPFSGQSVIGHVVYDADSPSLFQSPPFMNYEVLSFATPLSFNLNVGGVDYALRDTISVVRQSTFEVGAGLYDTHKEISGYIGDSSSYQYFVDLFFDSASVPNRQIEPEEVSGQAAGLFPLNFSIQRCADPACLVKNSIDGILVRAEDILVSPVASDVPEPSLWSMLIVGFGLIGAMMRRRQKVSVTFV